MSTTLTIEQEEKLYRALAAACEMSKSTTYNNGTKCSSYHIAPFKKHWDEKTAKEVAENMNVYLWSWVINPLSEALGVDEKEMEKFVDFKIKKKEIQELERQINESDIHPFLKRILK